jgi:O-antigen ligase
MLRFKAFYKIQTFAQQRQLEFEVLFYHLMLALCFTLSLKLVLTYIVLVPLFFAYILRHIARAATTPATSTLPLALPPLHELNLLLLFVVIVGVESLYGFNPSRSFSKLSPLLSSSLLILVARDFCLTYSAKPLVMAIVFGQIVASAYTIASKMILGVTPELFLGDVTQSGQIAIILPLGLGYLGHGLLRNNKQILQLAASSVCFALSALLHTWTSIPLAIVGYMFSRTSGRSCSLSFSILTGALLTNLKRGPWLGVSVSIFILLVRFRPKLILPLTLGVVSLILLVPPIRSRLQEGQNDFFIAGGRSAMWQLASELTLTFPLGIGYGNSKDLRQFSDEIPQGHRHFHNNILNILVETGWMGLAVFIVWLVALLSSLKSKNIVAFSGALAVLSNQLAGILEYNFGDTDIRILLFIVTGIMAASSCNRRMLVATP